MLIQCIIIVFISIGAAIVPLPTATIFPSGSAVPIVNQSFNLNCTGTGTLRWYRGFDFDTPLDRYTQLLDSINNTLLLLITLSDDDLGQTDERSRTYFCTANNSLGVARSQSVLIPCKREEREEGKNDGKDKLRTSYYPESLFFNQSLYC